MARFFTSTDDTDYADVFGWHGDGFLTANDANCRESNRHGYINGRKERRERKGKASIFMKFHVFHGSVFLSQRHEGFLGQRAPGQTN